MLEAKYDHKLTEKPEIYDEWINKGYFTAGDISKKPYSMVIPPPNVTGMLHLGHAWDFTLMDIITRYKRLQGYDVLSLPGMDHAGIATQAKVDERLRKEGTNRYEIGREKFMERAWEWKEEYAGHIRHQWASMGLGFDYSRERFTLDEGLSKAVRREFVQYYHEGLIYQGERIINWDPVAQTALSNIEVYHEDTEGAMYTFRYQVVETGEYINVATTRPETMFGDVCVVVHPDDERYAHVVGMHVINPANHEELPIITDDYIDIEFGTGAMKCTPAHDVVLLPLRYQQIVGLFHRAAGISQSKFPAHSIAGDERLILAKVGIQLLYPLRILDQRMIQSLQIASCSFYISAPKKRQQLCQRIVAHLASAHGHA